LEIVVINGRLYCNITRIGLVSKRQAGMVPVIFMIHDGLYP
jgi:hypothetical protein